MTAPPATAGELAAAQQRRQQLLTRTVVDHAEAAWTQVDPDAIVTSWAEQVPAVAELVAVGQFAAAAYAEEYVTAVAGESATAVAPAGFAGAAADGRSLVSLLGLPAGTTLGLIGSGLGVREALARGRAQLLLAAQTEVADAGRLATGTAITARPHVRGYIRVVSSPSCGRCVLLAGRIYRWSDGFQRHPRCDCVNQPITGEPRHADVPDPMQLFRGMTAEEQDRAFTRAGAQALRDGADISQVVNAQRGMYEAGGRQFTTEGTTRRGVAGKRLEQAGATASRRGGRYRRVNVPRLTPKQIYLEAAGDRAEAIRLLRRFGYLT